MDLQDDVARGPRILVAEDNPVNREVARHLLEQLGCSVETVTDGQQAVDAYCARAYDLLLMDCYMPGLNGFEAARRIRASEHPERYTPIIALSAATSNEEHDRCIAAGMDGFLSKPLRPRALADMLARWLPSPLTTEATAPATCDDELEAVQRMFGADFAALAMLYRTDSPLRIEAMRRAIAAADHAGLATVAHALAGSSMAIGATGLCALCRELERCAKNSLPDNAAVRLAAIETEYLRICGKLQDLVGREGCG